MKVVLPDSSELELPDGATGLDAAAGSPVDVWTIMPFDFGGGNMAQSTQSAAEGLKSQLMSAFGWSADTAYRHLGISSMNGKTDESDETVTLSDFRTILTYAQNTTSPG